MQNLENNMDQLFRKAVEHVPLLPVNSRWEEVSRKLSVGSPVSTANQKVNNFRRIVGMLLFFLLGIICSTLLTTFTKFNQLNIAGDLFNRTSILHNIKTIHSKNQASNTISTIKPSQEKNRSSNVFLINASKTKEYSDPLNPNNSSQPSEIKLITLIQDLNYNTPVPKYNFNSVGYNNLLQKHSLVELNENIENPGNLPLQHQHSSYNPHFYLGPVGGILMSQIKNQVFKKPGYDIGLQVGFKINKKLSLETGLLFTKQYYFAAGKYYNSVNGGTTAKSLEGSRTACEIPFKLNYYIMRNKTGGFFISGGVSSYVGVNDNIMINVGENNPGPSQKLDYGVASYLPSYLDFSLGYDYQLGRLSHIRIEPFVEIPMRSRAGNTININAGSGLRVFNAGLHLVITEFIH